MVPTEPARILDDYRSGRISRRRALSGLAASFAAVFAAGGTLAGNDRAFRGTALNHLALRVTDVARSRDFYVEHFGAEVLRDASSNCFLGFGENFLALFRGSAAGLDHFCFTIDDYDASDAFERLEARGLAPSRTENRVYFKDPDGLKGQLAGRYSSWPGPARR